MEVLVGSTTYAMEMEVSSAAAAAYVRDRTAGGTGGVVVPSAASAADNNKKVVSGSCLFLKEEEIGSDDLSGSSSSSSIGSDDDEDEGKDADGEVSSSKLSLDSLEDSLPIKRGLSNHFSGKSKSFANLSDVSTVTDLKKQENPFNKRRRVLIANKWSRKSSSFYSWQNPKSMPLLTVHEDQDHRDRDDDNDDDPDRDHEQHHTVAELGTEEKNQTRVFGNRLQKKIGFKSQRSFSLADLHDDDDEEEHR